MYDSIYMPFWWKQNYRNNEKFCSWKGSVGREVQVGEARGVFLSSEKILYDSVMVGTCYQTFVKHHRTWQHKDWTLMYAKCKIYTERSTDEVQMWRKNPAESEMYTQNLTEGGEGGEALT